MNYKYQIRHTDNGKGKLETSLTIDQLIEQYDQLPDFLSLSFEKGITVACIQTDINKMTIEITSPKTRNEIKVDLATYLAIYNGCRDGLNFIIL